MPALAALIATWNGVGAMYDGAVTAAPRTPPTIVATRGGEVLGRVLESFILPHGSTDMYHLCYGDQIYLKIDSISVNAVGWNSWTLVNRALALSIKPAT